MADWAAKFPLYDAKHPAIWELFKKYTFEMITAGHEQIGHGIIFGRIRYDAALSKKAGDTFKLNQNYATYYARKFVAMYPEWQTIFSFRVIRGQDIFEDFV